MDVLDLQLQQQQRDGVITAFVVWPSGHNAFQVAAPTNAIEWQKEWRRQFLAHHDPRNNLVSADAVRNFADGLTQGLTEWLELPACSPLRQALNQHPGLPLRLRLEGDQAVSLERLPWELLVPERPTWRLIATPPADQQHPPPPCRCPRVLLVVGDASDLKLEAEIEQLTTLHRRGRLALQALCGSACSLATLREQLRKSAGWDALIFLGHSESDPSGGGRLQLGDGSWVAATAITQELQEAAAQGLALALFNSCNGLDLARSSVQAGIAWALCFREPVPSHAATRAFSALLTALEAGETLLDATRQTRQALRSDPATVGTDLLLTLMATASAEPFRLPLRKRRQFSLRLAQSTRAQALTAAACVTLGAIADLNPANPVNTYLLDRRLYLTRLWRAVTHQPGPSSAALPVVVLDQGSAAELGAAVTPGRVSRDLLATVLQRIPVKLVPTIGLDLVLDEPAPFTERLAQVIRGQRRSLLFAGYFGEQVEAKAAGRNSMPLPVLQQAGLQARNLAVGTPALPGPLKWVPLQLWSPLDQTNFAGALTSRPAVVMPVDSIIDWSIDWRPLLQRVELADLHQVRADTLVVGTDGSLDRDVDDLFQAPGAMDPQLTAIWQGAERKVPGVLIQAVLAQSMRLNHWLTPMSQAATAAAAAGIGVLLAASDTAQRKRLRFTALMVLIAIPISLQITVDRRILAPLLIPISALLATQLVRRT